MENLFFRKAKQSDVHTISKLMLLAMEDIVYKLIGQNNRDEAESFLASLNGIDGNQYSYNNCWVAENEDGFVAVANVYDGANLNALRKPVLKYIKEQYDKDVTIENETDSTEYYIDTIAVDPTKQGKSIGTYLLQFLIKEYADKDKPLGLLVDKENPKAKKLYLKLGFEVVNEIDLLNKRMEHLQYSNK